MFKKHVVHKKIEVKVKRQLLSVSAPSGRCLDDVKHYVDVIKSKEPGVVHCQQPESLVRDILYPQNVKLKPGDPRLYGRENEGKAVQQYLELMTYYDMEVRVEETRLHVYHVYP
ncbi:hypothetical protein HPB47_015224 [Ixodes persulcatus]|uniref:Uncharacterized protein n=1 Tax=Ixodes persulcatus TaxID=34615 RepID=A0AC60QU62_IXOPE|nr:hypothetical protein HPB47_015224 [Ixodes persulcatus]